jgi:hypothetical protein
MKFVLRKDSDELKYYDTNFFNSLKSSIDWSKFLTGSCMKGMPIPDNKGTKFGTKILKEVNWVILAKAYFILLQVI